MGEEELDSIDRADYGETSQDDVVDLIQESEEYLENYVANSDTLIVEGKPQFNYKKLEPLVIKGKRYCIRCAELEPSKLTLIGRKKYFCQDHWKEYDDWRANKETQRLRFKRKHRLLKNEGIGTSNIREHPHRKKIDVNADGSNIYEYDFKEETKTVRNELNRVRRGKRYTKKERRNMDRGLDVTFRDILLENEVAYSDDYSTMYLYIGKEKTGGGDEGSDTGGSVGYWAYSYGDDELVSMETFFAPDPPKPKPKTLREIYEGWCYWEPQIIFPGESNLQHILLRMSESLLVLCIL
jgi:hypothetical protein